MRIPETPWPGIGGFEPDPIQTQAAFGFEMRIDLPPPRMTAITGSAGSAVSARPGEARCGDRDQSGIAGYPEKGPPDRPSSSRPAPVPARASAAGRRWACAAPRAALSTLAFVMLLCGLAAPATAQSATPTGLPSMKVTPVTVIPGDGQLTLSWDDPSDSTITRWEYRQKEGADNYGAWTTIPASGASTDSLAPSGGRIELDAVGSPVRQGIFPYGIGLAATAAVGGRAGAKVTQNGENRPPEFQETGDLALKVRENAAGAIGDPVTATDPDGDAVTYRLAGADAALFAIDAVSGQLSVGAFKTLDFEERTEYAFEVVATGADGLQARRRVVVTRSTSEVNPFIGAIVGSVVGSVAGLVVAANRDDENRPPEFQGDGDLALNAPENFTGNIGDPVTATDPDGDAVTYRLAGADRTLFAINAASAQLSVVKTLDFEEQPNKYAFEIVATDAGGLTAWRAVVVTVTDVNEDDPRLEDDWRALVALYKSTDGAHWLRNDNWSPSLDRVPKTEELDTWYGVTIPHNEGRVTSLELGKNNLRGSIPEELNGLTKLQELKLSGNRLTGQIPSELGELAYLRRLLLNVNELTGSIPKELGNLTNLQELALYTNKLSGPLPPELGNLTNLWELILYDNNLEGSISQKWGGLADLQSLYVQSNKLTGPMPSDLTNLSNLQTFYWYNQRVTDGETALCAPTDDTFQNWLKNVNISGQNCTDTEARAAGAGLSVADARVDESAGMPLRFVVTLRPASAGLVVTVNYATANGTAHAGSDYVATAGRLVFALGETVKTVAVTVLKDAHDEGAETMTLELSDASGAEIADASAVGTIVNSDALPKAWIARFGRTVTGQAVDAVEARLAGAKMVAGTSFALTRGSAGGGGFASVWGQGETGHFKGKESSLTLDGEVTTGFLGADWASERWMAGLAMGHSRGTGGYHGPDGPGEVEATLTGVYPYAGLKLTDRLSVWAAVGHGTGELTLKPGNGKETETDLSMTMAAAGMRSEVLRPEGDNGFAFAVKADTRFARTSSEEAKGASGHLAAADAEVWQARAGLEGSRSFALGDGGTALMSSFEVGLRFDGGDAGRGFGANLSGGLTFARPESGLKLELKARGLVAHEARGLREWGASAALSYDPRPSTERGLKLSLGQSWGASPSGGMEALLERETLAGRAANDNAAGGRLEGEIGYGLAAFGGGFTGTPYTGFGFSADGARDYKAGWRLTSARAGDLDFEVGLEVTRREAANGDDAPEHGAMLRATIRW